MSHMEVITRVERRRRYSDEEREAVLAQCDEPGATIVGVSASLIHGWRKTRREAQRIASEPLQFIPYGVVTHATSTEPDMTSAQATPAKPSSPAALAEDLIRPHPGARPGGIDIDLASGVRLSVDSYVNEKALARVLRALRDVA
ncbi:transposase [Croceibacterium mercuriale]|uniref:Transposase n=1 Tax=Croceibacterium mercuriale TaxID=1572751 RepID=A0A0B2BWA7_9SPHN|nr:transposase [Croceibacterium mercuriale]KHL24227.1 transposase [Croceibacterium mercuriale]